MIRAFFRAPSGIASLALLFLLLIVVVVAPIVWGDQATVLNIPEANQGMSSDHLFGTDPLGRDIFIRTMVAARLSIGLALGASGIGAILGITLGAAATRLAPRLRTVALRAIDTTLAFPAILVAIFIAAVLGPSARTAMFGVGIAISFHFARIASALAMSIGNRDFIAAARLVGNGRPRLLFRYVLPNIAETLVVTASVAISSSIVHVSSLSFLGIGVQSPDFDWGQMLTQGLRSIYIVPSAALAPALAITIVAMAFGFAGEAVARVMNPVLWTQGPNGDEEPAESADSRSTRGNAELETAGVAAANGPIEAESLKDLDPPEADAPALLEVSGLSVRFPQGEHWTDVVSDVSFSVAPGETLGIVGESGSGKSMTSLAVAGLVPEPGVVRGVVKLNGRDLQSLPPNAVRRMIAADLALVFQDPMTSLNPSVRIGTQLTEGVRFHRGLPRSRAKTLAMERLAEVNMPTPSHQMHRYPHMLSGGMRQRVMIAMGLMMSPTLLIADEPTTALDVTIQAQVMELLARINRSHGTAVILISHNLALISQNCSRALVMYGGRIVEDLTTEQFRTSPLHPYTRALIAAVPDMDQPRTLPVATIPGSAPETNSITPGCPFHPRCPLATEKCRVEEPPLVTYSSGQRAACWMIEGVE